MAMGEQKKRDKGIRNKIIYIVTYYLMGNAVSNKITTAQWLDPATMQWNDVSRELENILYFNILQKKIVNI